MKRIVYRARCVPKFDYTWIENIHDRKPLKMLRGDDPDKMRLERWYYFWINRNYTDPMVLIRNNDHCWTIHPGQNRWIAASLLPPREHDVLLITDRPLKKLPEGIHSAKVNNLSSLKPYQRPQPKSEDWLNQKPNTTWDQWFKDWNDLAKNIKQLNQGKLAIMDGNRTYTMGEGKIIACWPAKDTGIEAITSLFTFADSIGWNRPFTT